MLRAAVAEDKTERALAIRLGGLDIKNYVGD
jgi:hypothetical protein